MDREARRAVIHGVAKSRTRQSDWTELKYIGILYVKGSLLKKCFPKATKVIEIHSGQDCPLKISLTLGDMISPIITDHKFRSY